MQLNVAPIFDARHYESLNTSRAEVVSQLLAEIKQPLNLRTVVDLACGIGYFSSFLKSLGLDVVGVDGRRENVEEALRRHPDIRFDCYNVEDSALRTLGTFDLVFCFGLLYHLENPLLAIRHLHALTGQLLLVEGVIFPGREPIMGLVDEGPAEDQGLNHFAFYPTEACLEKMLHRAGFHCVYRFAVRPDHPDYRDSKGSPRVRTMLAASHRPISSRFLTPVQEPSISVDPWDAKSVEVYTSSLAKLRRFASKLFPEEVKTVKRRLREKLGRG